MSEVVAKIAQHKKDEVTRIAKLIKDSNVVGMLNMENLPAKQLALLRSKLRGEVTITMTRKSLVKRSIEAASKSKKGVEKLSESIIGMPALLFTNQNPFKVSALIRSSKSKAPAKPGQIAPYDLIIPAGPTSFTPGPIISELAAVGLKTSVENGKISIKQDAVVAKKGDEIDRKTADLLTKFSIEPMEVGLDMVAAFENGIIYGKDVLSIDQSEYITRLQTAALDSLALSMEIGYINKDNIELLIGKAFTTAKKFAIDNKLPSDVLLEKEIGEAGLAAEAIAKAANIEAEPKPESAPEKPKEPEVKKEETKVEEKKEEVKTEAPQPSEVKKEPVLEPQKTVEKPAEEVKQEQPEAKPQVEVKEAPKEEIKSEKPKEEQKPVEQIAEEKKEVEKKEEITPTEQPKPKETEVKQDKPETGAADLISKQFDKEISAEKERRDNVDMKQTEDMVKKLKKMGTLRKE